MNMQMVVKILSILVIIEGLIFIIRPGFLRSAIGWFKEGDFLFLPAVIKIALGIVLLIAATSCTRTWLIIVLGLLLCAAGLLNFTVKKEKLISIINFFYNLGPVGLRITAVCEIIFGLLLLYGA